MDSDSSTKFIGSLTKFLQSLCNGYVEFQRGVELVGHIYLSIDTGEKVDYILHEKVSKNDENSVTFVSNSFHAQPLDKDKPENKDSPSKAGAGSKGKSNNSSDDDDIVIVDHSKGIPGSSNSGSIPSRGVKRVGSPSSSDRHAQRMHGAGGPSSGHDRGSSSFHQNNRQHVGPSATVTSQSQAQQGGLNISDVKLEQISKDELMSLASQVGEGGSRPPHGASSTVHSHSPRTEGQVWVKQEAADDDDGGGNETGWTHGRDDSNSNSGSNLYPVMLHQNPATYSGSAFPGFSGPGSSGANPYADPLPGTSQDSSGLDPSGEAPLDSALFHMPVPDFSPALQEMLSSFRLLPHWLWVKTVQEAARFYLRRYPTELRDSNIYQSIGRAVYSHYPSIGTPGRKPWSKFIKSLSQKIRHLRHRRLRWTPNSAFN